MKILYYLMRIFLFLWPALLFGYSLWSVGEMGSCKPFSWSLPLNILLFFGVTALLGWAAAKEYYDQ